MTFPPALAPLHPSSSGEGEAADSGSISGSGHARRSPMDSSPTTDYEDSFFGGGDSFEDDPAGDSLTEGDPFSGSFAPARRSLPTGPVVGGVVLLLLVAFLGLRGLGEGPAEASSIPAALKTVTDTQTKAKEAADADSKKEAEAKKAAAVEAAPPPPVADPQLDAKIAEARTAYDKHKLKALKALLDELVPKHPAHPDLLLLQAQLQLESGDLEASMTAASKCVEVAATQADCWLTLGVLHQNNKSDADATTAYETYLKLAPEGRYARDATTQLARLK